jgi:hypothetical protein
MAISPKQWFGGWPGWGWGGGWGGPGWGWGGGWGRPGWGWGWPGWGWGVNQPAPGDNAEECETETEENPRIRLLKILRNKMMML